jgi:hypothetical protein
MNSSDVLARAVRSIAVAAVVCATVPSLGAQEPPVPSEPPQVDAPASEAPSATEAHDGAAAPTEQEPAGPVAAPGRVPTAPPVERPTFALVGGTVFTLVEGEEPFVATVLVVNGRIDAIGPDLVLPLGCERIDCTGLFVVPGLVDGMMSYDPEHDALYTAHGITSVRDMGGDPDVLAELESEYFRERVPGPFLISAGGVVDGAPPITASAIVVRTPEEVERFLSLLKRIGADFISLMPSAPRNLLDAIYAQSDSLALDVWGMVPRGVALMDAVARGHDGFLGVDAFLPLDTATEDPLDRLDWGRVSNLAFKTWAKNFAESRAALVPVLAEGSRLLTPRDANAPELEYLNFFYTAQWLAEWQRRRSVLEDATNGPAFVERTNTANTRRAELFAALVAADAKLVPGSSAPLNWTMPGASLHDELEAWSKAGAPPLVVLRAATARAADVFGLAERGRLKAGAVADLLVVGGDPRESLASLRRPLHVVVRGRPFAKERTDELLAELAARQAAVRAENARPLHVDPPEHVEGAVVLAGHVETRYLAERLSSERYAIVQRPDGTVAITSRLVQPPNGSFQGGEMSITQVLRDGLMETFIIRIERRASPPAPDATPIEAASMQPDVLIVRGLWANGRFNVERALNGQPLGTQSMVERPVAITLDALADTVTCPLVLGQYPATGNVHALTFGDLMEPIKIEWRIQDHPSGDRWVASAVGVMRIEYAKNGALVRALYNAGGQTTSMAALEGSSRDFGGPGFPVVFTPPPAEPTPTDAAGGDTGAPPALPSDDGAAAGGTDPGASGGG